MYVGYVGPLRDDNHVHGPHTSRGWDLVVESRIHRGNIGRSLVHDSVKDDIWHAQTYVGSWLLQSRMQTLCFALGSSQGFAVS